MPIVAVNLVGILTESGAAELRGGARLRRRRGSEGRGSRRRTDGACLGDRRRREFAVALRPPPKAAGEKSHTLGRALGHDHAAFGGVRA